MNQEVSTDKTPPGVVTTCPTCGHGMKSFWHTLTPGLVSILVRCIQFVHEKGRNEFHLQHDLNLTINQFSNFTKLRFHGLVAHVPEKPGYWLITARAGQFLRREIVIPLRVKTFRNRVEEHSTEVIHIDSLRNKIPYFETDFAYEIMKPKKVETTTNALL